MFLSRLDLGYILATTRSTHQKLTSNLYIQISAHSLECLFSYIFFKIGLMPDIVKNCLFLKIVAQLLRCFYVERRHLDSKIPGQSSNLDLESRTNFAWK